MARVYVLSGHDLGKSFEVTSGSVLGRASECDVPLRDASISRHHAKLEWAKGSWSVVDLNSRNGVVVKGAKVAQAELAEGTEFKLGEVLLRFRAHAPTQAEPQAGAAPAVSAAPAAPAAPAVPPPKAAAEPEEILLEGDWGATPPASAPPKPTSLPASPTQPTMFTPRSVVPRADAPAAPQPVALETTPAPRALTSSAPLIEPRGPAPGVKTTIGASSTRAGGVEHKDRGVLQYSKQEQREGLFQSDLGQQPIYVKIGVWLLALVLFAAVVWGAFHATTFFKAKVAGGTEQGEELEPR